MTAAMTGYSSPGGSKTGISAYSGGCIDQTNRKLYFLGGGHYDYGGNEVLRLDLAGDTPTWSVIGPYVSGAAAPTPNASQNSFYYNDSRDSVVRPCSRHTYFSPEFVPSRNRIVMHGAGAIYGAGTGNSNQTDAFNLSTLDYDAQGTYANCPIPDSGRAACSDGNGDIWVWSAGVAKLSGTTWTNYGNPTNATGAAQGFCLAFDTTRNRILRVNYEYGWRVLDLSGTPTVSSPTNLRASSIGSAYTGTFHWSPSLGCFIYFHSNRTLWKITPQAAPSHDFTVSQITTTGTPPGDKGEGSYWKGFLWLESLQVGIAIQRGDMNVRVIRVS